MATVFETESNDFTSRANSLNLGDTARGALSSSSDWDFFKLSVAASGVLKLDFTPPTASSSNYFYLVVYDSSNKLLAADFAGNTASLSLGLPSAGTYYVAVTAASLFSSGQYALTTSAGSGSASGYESEINNTLASANTLVLAQSIKGQLASSSDVDYYRVTANSAGVLVVDFAASKVSNGSSFTLGIYDASGNLVTTQSTGSTASVSTVVGAAGDYYVKVAQANIYDGGNYTLTASNDSLANMGARAFAGSSPLTATLSGGHDWYAVNLVAGSTYQFAVAGSVSGGGTLSDPALTLCYANGAVLETCDDLKVWSSILNQATTTADPQIAFTAPASGSYYLMVSGKGATGSYTLSQTTDVPADLTQALLELQTSPNYRWNGGSALGTPVSLTYAFLTSTADGESGFVAMTTAQKQVVRDVLAMYESIANISFAETSNLSAASIRFGTSNEAGVSSGVTYTSLNGNGSLSQAEVFLNNTSTGSSSSSTSTLTPGGYGYMTLIHEIGHALGLKHPGNYNSTGSQGANPPYLPNAADSEKFTVMSYLDNADSSIYHSTPALLDVAALQYLYGANTSAAGASRTFAFSNSSAFVTTLLSSGSNDTIDISNQTLPSQVFLAPGSLSSIGASAGGVVAHDNVAIAFNERVVAVIDGPAADLIVGNTLDNSFYGFGGRDTMLGGGGNDTLILTASSTDLNAAADAQLSAVQTISAATSTAAVSVDLHQQSEAISIVGSSFGDSIIASGGGGSITGGAGNDTITGGAGSDIAVYSGNRANYLLTQLSAGQVSIQDRLGSGGSDTLISVEDARYADGMQNLAITRDAAAISASQLKSLTELYIAYFNRVPEASGLDYWINNFRAGMSLIQIGDNFYSSAVSFSSLTGYSSTMSDASFISKIYQNVLGRSSPDPAGLAYWQASLADGSQTRGSLINTIITAAHTYKGDLTYGAVADLLDNKASVGIYNAVTAAVDYLTPEESINRGMAIAAAITATDTSHAITLIGLADQVPYVA